MNNKAERQGPMVGTVAGLSVAAWAVLGIIAPGGITVFAATSIAGVLLFGAGYLLLRVLGNGSLPLPVATVLALPAGTIVAGSLAQILFHSLGQLQCLCWVIALLAVPGLVLAARETWNLWRHRLKFGRLYVILIVAVGVSYYCPKATQDSTRTPDGNYHWIYPDSAFHQAVADMVAVGKPPLRVPAYVQALLPYHYGRHALAAAIANVSGNSVGDCLARCLHWLGLASLLLAALGLGWVAAGSPEQRPLSGLLAIALAFFAFSFPAIALNEGDSCGRRPQIILPESKVVNELGPALDNIAMGHYFESGSILWAGIVVLAVAALLHCSPDAADRSFKGLPYSALLLSLTGMALNGVAGVIGLAVVAGFALVRDRGLRGLAFAAVAALLFRLFQHLMGLDQPLPQNNSLLDLAGLPFRLPRAALRGFFLLLSFRAMCIPVFVWGSRAGKLVLALFGLASLGLYVLCDLQGYPLGILAVVLAGFAAAPLAVVLHALSAEDAAWRGAWGLLTECYRRYVLGLAAVVAVLLPLAWYPFFHHRTLESIYGFSILLPLVLLACGGILGLLRWMSRRNVVPSRAAVFLTLGVLGAFSLAGWLRSEVNVVFDLLGNSIGLDAGRVKSLEFAGKNLPPESIFATTHHDLEVRSLPERSYCYVALAQRYSLLEGWLYCGVLSSAGFEQTRRDNELLFTTHDAESARRIVAQYGITHLLVEPGCSLGFDAAQANWLKPLENPGTLAIFEVVGSKMSQEYKNIQVNDAGPVVQRQ